MSFGGLRGFQRVRWRALLPVVRESYLAGVGGWFAAASDRGVARACRWSSGSGRGSDVDDGSSSGGSGGSGGAMLRLGDWCRRRGGSDNVGGRVGSGASGFGRDYCSGHLALPTRRRPKDPSETSAIPDDGDKNGENGDEDDDDSSNSSNSSSSRKQAVNGGSAEAEAEPPWATEHEYLVAARAALDAVYEGALSAAEDGSLGADFDAEWDGGVVRLQLGGQSGGGTYVANTQTPNRQIWLSSPVSGPWRYAWDADRRCWASTRDGHALLDLLERELSAYAGRAIVISDPTQGR